MGVMFPLLAGCRLVFTAVIMVDITVVKYPVSVKGGMQPLLVLWLLYAVGASAGAIRGLI